MIKILFKRKEEKIISFNITGHADFDEFSKDIVCSAVSVLSQTTLIGIQEVLKIQPKYEIKDGFLNLSLENENNESIDKCQVLLETMYLGLKSLEIGYYGNYVKVEEV